MMAQGICECNLCADMFYLVYLVEDEAVGNNYCNLHLGIMYAYGLQDLQETSTHVFCVLMVISSLLLKHMFHGIKLAKCLQRRTYDHAK